MTDQKNEAAAQPGPSVTRLSSLAGRVVVVTGASRGLGAALAQAALTAGAKVGACSRGEPAITPGATAVVSRLSVDNPEALTAFADEVWEKLGPIDLWINNAGVLGPVGPLRDAPTDELLSALQINVFGTMLGGRYLARRCRAIGHRSVLINLSSGAARRAYAGWSAYCGSKAAVDRLSEVLALEEQPLLRVHSLAPGVFESEMQATLRTLDAERFPEVNKFKRLHADGALHTPQAVAVRILSLAFESWGQGLPVCLDLRELPQSG